MVIMISKDKLIFNWQDIVETTEEYIQDKSLISIGLSKDTYYKLCEIVRSSKNFYSFAFDTKRSLVYNNYPVYLDSSLSSNEMTVCFEIECSGKCIEISREDWYDKNRNSSHS
jgi:hypothetical protein